MSTSQNGWPASSDPSEIGVQPCTVAGMPIGDGLKAGPVTTVLSYVLLQLHRRVEPLVEGQCWGYKYRPITGSTELSNHASATAVDVNAPAHPQGKRTFTAEQVAEIRRVLAEVGGVVRWGGDFANPDEMHFEIDSTPESVAAVAARLEANVVTFGLDISHHQDLALDLARCRREGIEFVFIKATEGSSFVDSEFAANLTEARDAGLLVAAYHYVRSGAAAAAQAELIRGVVPRDVPVIPDVEDGSGGVQLTRDLIDRLQRMGYRVPLLYLPRWYWQQIGSPSLAWLPPLWSSRYPDRVVGTLADEWDDVPASYWTGYGGLDVAVLQFTSSAAIAGHQPLDANAYRGTRAQLAALLGGTNPQEDDMGAYETNILERISIRLGGLLKLEEHVTADLTPTGTGGVDDRLDEDLLLVKRFLAVERDVAELKSRPAADVDEAALAAELDRLGIGGATAEEVKEVVRQLFARAGQPEGSTT